MSAKPETTFISGVHNHFPSGRKDPYWMKNNNVYTGGIWDVWYSGKAGDLWVEYKYLDRIPIQKPFMPALSALQLDWGRERFAEGRNLAVIVGCRDGGVIFEGLEWESEITNAAFKVRIQSRQEIADWIIKNTAGAVRKKRK